MNRFVATTWSLCIAAVAHADFTVGPMAMSSAGSPGNAGNSVLLYTYTGPDTVIDVGAFSGALLEVDTDTYASEAQWNIRNTRFPASEGVNYQVSFASGFSGTILIAADSGAGLIVQTGDVLHLETFEFFDDSAGSDAVWTDASFVFAAADDARYDRVLLRRASESTDSPQSVDCSVLVCSHAEHFTTSGP